MEIRKIKPLKTKKALHKQREVRKVIVKGREGSKDDFMAVLKRMVTSPKN